MECVLTWLRRQAKCPTRVGSGNWRPRPERTWAPSPRADARRSGSGGKTTFELATLQVVGAFMANLIAVIILAVAATLLWLSRKSPWCSLHPVAYRAVLSGTCAWTLLLALRFGARTYPGVWMGGPGLLNDIFNSSEIFWIGCYAVLLAVIADGLVLYSLAHRQPYAEQALLSFASPRSFEMSACCSPVSWWSTASISPSRWDGFPPERGGPTWVGFPRWHLAQVQTLGECRAADAPKFGTGVVSGSWCPGRKRT